MHSSQLEKHTRNIHTQDIACDECDFLAKNNQDLTKHVTYKHPKSILCEQCGYEAHGNNDLNSHKRRTHRTRYFSRSLRSNNTEQYLPRRDKREYKTQDCFNEDKADKNIPQKEQFHCAGKCDSIQKSFTHKDELELHIQYYHEAQILSESQ